MPISVFENDTNNKKPIYFQYVSKITAVIQVGK